MSVTNGQSNAKVGTNVLDERKTRNTLDFCDPLIENAAATVTLMSPNDCDNELQMLKLHTKHVWASPPSRLRAPDFPNAAIASLLSAFGSLPCLAQTCPCDVKSASCIDLSVSEPRHLLRPRILLKAPTLAEMEEMSISEVRGTHRQSLVLILCFSRLFLALVGLVSSLQRDESFFDFGQREKFLCRFSDL